MTGYARVSAILFTCLFAAQAALIALSPVLAQVASKLDVSTATVGQLRTVSGLAAGVTALGLGVVAGRLGLRRLLVAGSTLLVLGSLASAAAPGFAWLALAQVPVGVAVAVLVTGATAAAAEWVAPERRPQVLSWALIGNPAAWIVGMPAIGLVGAASWRYAWLAVPLVAALAAGLAAAHGPRTAAVAPRGGGLRDALSDPDIARWALGELLANSAWIGLLVYVGALFVESYGTSPARTGAVLSLAALAFTAGNLTFRRYAAADPRRLLVTLALVLAVVVPLLGALRIDGTLSALLLAVAAFLGGARTLLGNAYGLHVASERRVPAMAARAAANQFGYFLGSAVAGAALAAFGYAGLGVALGALLVGAAVLLQGGLGDPLSARRGRRAAASRAAA